MDIIDFIRSNYEIMLEVLGFTIGIFYLIFEYKANRMVWLMSVIMPFISLFIYFSKGLYADFAINIYYLVIAVYGFILWSRKSKTHEGVNDKRSLTISHTPRWMYLPLICATIVIWCGIWWILVTFTPSNVPVADAFTTALSIVALWMMARKYAEQWLGWLIVDGVCVGLYIYKGIVFYALLYAVYTIVAVFGYRKWCRMIPK